MGKENTISCHPERSEGSVRFFGGQAPLRMTGELGRSMVEMLGVLAIMGVVGMVGIKMYSVAMNKHHANTLIEQAQRRAVSVAGQINLMGHAPSLADFSENTFGGGTFGGVTQEGLSRQFGIQVSGVPKAVCENILNAIGENTSLRQLNLISAPTMSLSTCTDNNAFLMIYNNDLKGANGDPSYTCNTDTDCATLCGTCGENHLCTGECPAESKTCSVDAECQQEGIICAGCNHRLGMCQSCQPIAYLESTGTQYIDTDYILTHNNSFELKFETTTPFHAMSIFGSRSGGTAPRNISISVGTWGNSGTRVMSDFNNSSAASYRLAVPYVRDKIYVASTNKNERKINEYTNTNICNDSITTPEKAYLFNISGSPDTQTKFTGKVYYCKIWNESSLVRDFIPVLDPNGTPAMFDRVNNQLYYNAGTGQFLTN